MTPPTSNTITRRPGRASASASEPAPARASVVTRTMSPPRPPRVVVQPSVGPHAVATGPAFDGAAVAAGAAAVAAAAAAGPGDGGGTAAVRLAHAAHAAVAASAASRAVDRRSM